MIRKKNEASKFESINLQLILPLGRVRTCQLYVELSPAELSAKTDERADNSSTDAQTDQASESSTSSARNPSQPKFSYDSDRARRFHQQRIQTYDTMEKIIEVLTPVRNGLTREKILQRIDPEFVHAVIEPNPAVLERAIYWIQGPTISPRAKRMRVRL